MTTYQKAIEILGKDEVNRILNDAMFRKECNIAIKYEGVDQFKPWIERQHINHIQNHKFSMTLKQLKESRENYVNSLIEYFIKKQDTYFEFWFGDKLGGIACISADYYISFSDIEYDVFNRVKKGVIFKWQDYVIECCEKGVDSVSIMSYDEYILFSTFDPNNIKASKKKLF